ncbi:hypothetical protein HRbin08_00414 [bacterium HR08]|nr:hypothetical protein HRbin08_00414 [bacterium HR08]
MRFFIGALIIGLSGAHGAALAQVWGTLTGRVMARLDHRPLAGISVEVENVESGGRISTITDEWGHFAFPRLAPGRYRLVVAPEGFRPERRVLRLAPRDMLALEILLDVEPLREVVTVEAAHPVELDLQPRGTFIEGARIAALPGPLGIHLPEIIATFVPGAARSHDDLVHVRGSELALNVMLNGVLFWENPHALFSAGLDPGIIESVNVVTGPFSAEYGNRFGGVLDIVTRSGLGRPSGGSVAMNVGTTLRHHAAIEYGGHRGRFGYYVRGLGFQSARFLSPPEPEAHHDVGRGLRTFAQFDIQLNARDLLRFTLMGNGLNFEIPNTAEQERFGRDLRQHAREQTFLAGWNRVVSSRTSVHAVVYQRFSQVELLPSGDPRSVWVRFSRRLDTLGVKADASHVRSGHVMKAGCDVVSLRPREELLLDPTPYQRHCDRYDLLCLDFRFVSWRAREHGWHASAYGQDRFRIGSWMSVEMGLRVDAHRVLTRSVEWSPRVGLSFLIPRTGATLQVSYNRLFIPPPMEAILLSGAAPGIFIRDYASVPARPVLPETAHQFHAGLTRTVGESLRVQLLAFYRWGDRPMHTVQFPEAWIFPYVNFDRERVMGADLSLEVSLLERLGLSGFFNYSVSRAYYYPPMTGGFTAVGHGGHEGRFLAPFDQTHTGTAGALWAWRRRGVWAGLWFEYGSGTPIHEAGEGHVHAHAIPQVASPSSPRRVPGHLVAHLGMGIDVWRRSRRALTLRWGIENVADNVYVVARQSLFTPGQVALPRQVSASLKFSF